MATIKATFEQKTGDGGGSVVLITWTSLVAGSLVGEAVKMPEWSDNCLHVVANAVAGATCIWQGSNTDVDSSYGTLYDAQGNALSFTATGAPKQIVERPLYMRPKISGGSGTEDWTITLLLHRSTPLRT